MLMAGDRTVTLTAAKALLWLSAVLVAAIVMLVAEATDGAVSRPPEEMLPALVDQITSDWLAPLTTALNWSDPPDATVALVGEILVLT